MNVREEAREVKGAFASRSNELAAAFNGLMESLMEGYYTGQEAADRFNEMRVNFVIDLNGGEWSDFLLEFEEELAKS